MKSISQLKNFSGKRVLVRADFNVPVKNGKIQEEFKLQKSLPSIKYLLKRNVQVVLVSHLGRPKGSDKKLSLRPVAAYLTKQLGRKVPCITLEHYERLAQRGKAPAIVLLENIRFYIEEEKNDTAFAKRLAALADIFVLDGFGVAHRDAASVSGVAKLLPSYAGLLLAEEVGILSQAMQKPQPPLVVILGGAKVETKIPVMKQLLPKADYILVGGEIANTYWWAKGMKVGGSLISKKFKREVLRYCANKKVILPVDAVVGNRDGTGAKVVPVNLKSKVISLKSAVYDIGPATITLFAEYIKNARTLVWNGALGMFEQAPYHYGTYALADLFAARSKGKALGIAGGGETVQVLQKRGILDSVDLVSTGGGAMLEFLSGKKLPGLRALT